MGCVYVFLFGPLFLQNTACVSIKRHVHARPEWEILLSASRQLMVVLLSLLPLHAVPECEPLRHLSSPFQIDGLAFDDQREPEKQSNLNTSRVLAV